MRFGSRTQVLFLYLLTDIHKTLSCLTTSGMTTILSQNLRMMTTEDDDSEIDDDSPSYGEKSEDDHAPCIPTRAWYPNMQWRRLFSVLLGLSHFRPQFPIARYILFDFRSR